MMGLITIVAAAGLIWLAVVVLRVPPLLVALATVLIGAALGAAFLTFPIAGVRMTLDRLMLPLLIAAFIVQRQQGRFQPKFVGHTEWLLLAFLAWITVSMLLNDFRLSFGHSSTPLWRWSTAYCIPIAIYFLVRESSPSPLALRSLQVVLVLFGIYLAFTGLCEIAHVWALVFPKHIADPTAGIHFGRARGPMVTSVSFGLYLGVALLALWAIRDRLGRARWFVLPPLTALFAAALYFSYTRSSWLGTGAGLLLLLAASMRGRARALVVTAAASCAVLLLATKLDKIVSLQREQTAAVAKDSAECRLSFAYVSWRMFQDSPVWGFGFGQFPVAKMPYISDRIDLPLEQIRPLVHHNTYLSLLTETGFVGLFLFVATLFGLALNAWRWARHPATPPWARRQAVLLLAAIGLYACQYAFHELSYSTIDNSLLFLLAGATTGACFQQSHSGVTDAAAKHSPSLQLTTPAT